jgi:ADP-ribose pyrophosphatase YjhB (NUDIX family)
MESQPPVDPKWLEWGKRLQAAAQNGLAYAHDPFDVERYRSLRDLAVEILSTYTAASAETLHDLYASEIGHATPKVDVRGVVFRDDAVLLVKERVDGRWSLPGGWADVYDTPSQATVREIYEETGYRTRATKLLALYDRNRQGHPPHPFHSYKIFFQCELLGGEPAVSIETEGAEFFPENALPELSIGRVTEAQIHRFFQHYRHPDMPADFD